MDTERKAKRERTIAAINARTKPPTEDQLRSLREHGCDNWGQYFCDQADNVGMSVNKAFAAFSMLGEEEAFDGFVTTLEDEGGDEE